MPLWRLHGFAAAVSGSLRRGLSTAAARPPWMMIDKGVKVLVSSAQRVSLELAASPGVSQIVVPVHLLDLGPEPGDPDGHILHLRVGRVGATSGDGLLLLEFMDVRVPASPSPGSTFHLHSASRATRERKLPGSPVAHDITRSVCNPITGQLIRLPDIDGTKKTMHCQNFGLLTRSSHEHGVPHRYAVASLDMEGDGDETSFVVRRFLSGTGEWEKFVCSSPLARPLDILPLHEVLAFAGRLWWIDPSCGAVSADPFSDRPELSFVELPRGRLLPVPSSAASTKEQRMFRRMGVSEGRLRYVELSCESPLKLSSFALDDDGCSWTLEHQVALGSLKDFDGGRHTPWIGAIDPLNASVVCLIVGIMFSPWTWIRGWRWGIRTWVKLNSRNEQFSPHT